MLFSLLERASNGLPFGRKADKVSRSIMRSSFETSEKFKCNILIIYFLRNEKGWTGDKKKLLKNQTRDERDPTSHILAVDFLKVKWKKFTLCNRVSLNEKWNEMLLKSNGGEAKWKKKLLKVAPETWNILFGLMLSPLSLSRSRVCVLSPSRHSAQTMWSRIDSIEEFLTISHFSLSFSMINRWCECD